MPSPASDPSSESLLPPIRAAEATAGFRSWSGASAARRLVPWNRRISLLASGIVAVCSLTALLTWAATSVGPAPRVAVTLAGSDYRNQLDLPPNGYGDRALGRLASWLTAGPHGPRRDLQLARPPVELATSDDFDCFSPDPQAAVALMFVSAHGISTLDGPAILPAGASAAGDAVPVSSLLQQIATFPDKQKKILLLDCVHFDAQPQYGVLLNGFSAQMQELESQISAIPNLVVVIGCDANQQNWLQPAEGTNNWTAALLQGLNGAAEDTDNDGWIDWLEVHQYCVRHCDEWARRVCGQPQTPVLLPRGERGVQRSKNLALFPVKTPVVEVPSLVASTRTELLQQWWDKHDALQNRSLPAVVVSPVAWRRFERTLQRFEQFELAGCRDAADQLLEQLQELAQTLEQTTVLESVACRVGVLDPRMVGFDATAELNATASRLAVLLPDMSPEDAVDHWQQVLTEHSDASSVAYLRREIIEQRIHAIARNLREQAKIDATQLRQASQVVFATTDPLQPVPQAGLILQLIARDLDCEPLSSDDATSLGRLLELALRSDRVATGHPWWSPGLFRWVADLADHADQQRRIAGDLLFGEAEARARAVPALDEAERTYAELDRIAELLIRAEQIRLQGPRQLSRARTLLAARCDADTEAISDTSIEAIEQLYDLLDQMADSRFSTATAPPSQRAVVLRELEELTQRFQRILAQQTEHLNQWQSGVLASAQRPLPEVLAAFATDGESANQRITAWKRLRRLASSSPDSRKPPQTETPDRLPQVQRAAAIRGRLWLAAWPDSALHNVPTGPLATRAQVAHRLQIFASDPQWRTVLSTAAQQIGLRETAARQATQATASDAPNESVAHKIDTNDFPSRWLAMQRMSAVPAHSFQRTITQYRGNRLAEFLAWQAKRMIADHYWSLHANIMPYYVRVAELLSEDGTALSAVPLKKDASSQLAGNGEISLVLGDDLVWTTQQSDQVAVRVRTPQTGRHGFATLWVSATGQLQVTQPTAGQRVCRPLTVVDQHANPLDSSAADGLLVQLQRIVDQAPSEATQLRIQGYYRGRHLQRVVDVPFASQADIHIVQPPVAPGGRIAVRAGQKQAQSEHSALTLVIDCSGSMGAPRGQAFGSDTKYAHAVTAIEALLDKLPSGITLSVWAFGQAIGEEKTVQPAEKSIRRIQSPMVWDATDPQMRKQLIDAVAFPTLEPWNESPLLAAMIAASNDLREVPGLRSLVVITDGADNRVASDPVSNPLGLTASELLEQHFSDSGITVNVVAFRVEPHEQADTRQQLKRVEDWLPAGRFVEANQAEELASALHDMLRIPQAIQLHSNLTQKDITLPISPSNGAANWTPVLAGGLYQSNQNSSTASSLVRLRNGDRLVLQPAPTGTLEPWSQINHSFHWCERRTSGRWQWALAPVAVSDPSRTQANLIVETTDTYGTIAVERPGELWLEAFHAQQPLQVRWQRQSDLPGAAYNLRVNHPAGIQPMVRLWMSERGTSPVGELKRGRDFRKLDDLAPAKWQLSSGEIRLLSANIETHTVPDQSGTPKPQPCLVLRGSCPPGMNYRLRTVGLAPAGQDEQCFTTLGRFTLRQWPVSEEQVQQALQAVQLISVDQFKLETSLSGGQIQFGQADSRGQQTAAAATLRVRGQR